MIIIVLSSIAAFSRGARVVRRSSQPNRRPSVSRALNRSQTERSCFQRSIFFGVSISVHISKKKKFCHFVLTQKTGSHSKLPYTEKRLAHKNVSPSKSASHTNLSPTPICTLHKSVPHTNLSAHKSVSHTNLSPSQIYLLHKSVSPSKTSPSHNSYLLAKRGVL